MIDSAGFPEWPEHTSTRGMRGGVLVNVYERDGDAIKRVIRDAYFETPAQARAYAMRWKHPRYRPLIGELEITYREAS